MSTNTARMITPSTTHSLYGWNENFAEVERPVKALLFGQIVKRASIIVEHYESDLFHDALWIERNIHGADTFYLVLRESGTQIGADFNLVKITWEISGGQFYKVDLFAERGMWKARFTNLTGVHQ